MTTQTLTARIDTDHNGTVVTVFDHEGNEAKRFSYGPGRHNFGMATEFHRAGYEIILIAADNTCKITPIDFDA